MSPDIRAVKLLHFIFRAISLLKRTFFSNVQLWRLVYLDSHWLEKHYIPHLKALISALHVGEINCGSKVRGFSGIPRKFSPIPRFLGTGTGTGILGNLDWGFLGINPENPRISGTGTGIHLSKGSGTGRGRGQLKASGNRARFPDSPNNPRNWN